MKLLKILSIQQWLKNGLIFVPALFAVSAWDSSLIGDLFQGALSFSLLTSAVYLNNDLHDVESDRKHPEKRKRLIASGQLLREHARRLAAIIFALGISGLVLIGWQVAVAGIAYVLLNLLYTAFGKHIPVLDLFFISIGYIIRLSIGGIIAMAPLSGWVISVVCLLAIYLVLLKRVGDVNIYIQTGEKMRRTVVFYSKLPLRALTLVLIHIIICVYSIYIHAVFGSLEMPYAHGAYATIPLAYIALFRYNNRALLYAQQDPISILLKDYASSLLLILSFIILIVALYAK